MLGIELATSPGRKSGAGLEVGATRALTKGDMVAGSKASAPVPLRELRPSHRMIAELLSKGVKPGEVSIITGYSVSRISVLQNDPAFKELMELQQARQEQISEDLRAKVQMLGHDALAIMHARLIDNPDDFSNAMLKDLLMDTLDRSGVGPKSTTEHRHLHVGADVLDKLKSSAQEKGRVFDASTRHTSGLNTTSENGVSTDSGAQASVVLEGRAVCESTTETQGNTGEGKDLRAGSVSEGEKGVSGSTP